MYASVLRPLARSFFAAYAQLTKIRHYWHFVSLEMFHFFATKVLGLAREESGHRFGSFSMESLPDDLWRIVFAFAGPAPGARHVAARARTLDEFVDDPYR